MWSHLFMIPWFGYIAFGCFVTALLDLDLDKRILDWASSGTETCHEGKSFNSMTKVSKRRFSYAFTPVFSTHYSYKCMGASDNIFDHFIFLSSVPTIPTRVLATIRRNRFIQAHHLTASLSALPPC
jgi:hypothetical protein